MDNTLNEFACSITLITDTVKELRQIEEQKAISASEGRHDKTGTGISSQTAGPGAEQASLYGSHGLERPYVPRDTLRITQSAKGTPASIVYRPGQGAWASAGCQGQRAADHYPPSG